MLVFAILFPVVLGWGIYEIVSGSGSGASGDDDNKPEETTNEQVFSAENGDIVGTDGDDEIVGTAENDVIFAAKLYDTVSGGDGDDYIYGEGGNDDLHGDAGNDTIEGGDGFDFLAGGEGNDVLDGGLVKDSLEGGLGDDSILGGQNADSIDGGFGNDTLLGGLGKDTIFGQAGVDIISGGNSDDWIDGGDDADRILGENGDDKIYGGNGADYVDGGLGSDMIQGGASNDTLFGSWSPDQSDMSAEMYVAYQNAKADPALANASYSEILASKYFEGIDTSIAKTTMQMGTGDGATGGFDRLFGGSGSDVIVMGQGDTAFGDDVDGGEQFADVFEVYQNDGGAPSDLTKQTVIYDFQPNIDSLNIVYDGDTVPTVQVEHIADATDPEGAGNAVIKLNSVEFMRLNGVAASDIAAVQQNIVLLAQSA